MSYLGQIRKELAVYGRAKDIVKGVLAVYGRAKDIRG